MPDNFASHGAGLDSPASDSFPITPNDGADLAVTTRAIRASAAGNVVADMVSGATRTLAFTAGETRAVRVKRVRATGTTATGLEGMV